MGKLSLFNITLTNSSRVYYPGNIVKGLVTVDLKEPMKMRGIKINFKGKAYVHWTETRSSGKTTYTQHYSAKEKYFDEDAILYGIASNQGSDTTNLAQGQHTFPFEFHLPASLPSSFESKIGHVRYFVRCNIDKPWKFDHSCKCPFTIISDLDLNNTPAYAQKLQDEKQKNLCCLCCKSGPISATFSIERRGYVPGEAIKLFAEIRNGSNRTMDKSYVDLKMTKKTVTEIAKLTRPGIKGHREDVWTGEEMVIPPLPPSFLQGCKIVDINYRLQLNVDPKGPSLDLEVPFEVVIGTIPLAKIVSEYPPMPPPVGAIGGWCDPASPLCEDLYPAAPPTGIPNLPPPMYSECFTGPVDIKEDGDNEYTGGGLTFAPTYTYYNWGHPIDNSGKQ